ncbi:hypothetical protein EVAR_17027_1 [Eumeta japonica]|uniref:Uncharacterized protein n=1 Tax=Eumeta variegata TaxID=151549 RepID=A0A4C1V4J0_EUMVA|nr:hypothetical protein EVAR_17027_1 [Eumeta japonica]
MSRTGIGIYPKSNWDRIRIETGIGIESAVEISIMAHSVISPYKDFILYPRGRCMSVPQRPVGIPTFMKGFETVLYLAHVSISHVSFSTSVLRTPFRPPAAPGSNKWRHHAATAVGGGGRRRRLSPRCSRANWGPSMIVITDVMVAVKAGGLTCFPQNERCDLTQFKNYSSINLSMDSIRNRCLQMLIEDEIGIQSGTGIAIKNENGIRNAKQDTDKTKKSARRELQQLEAQDLTYGKSQVGQVAIAGGPTQIMRKLHEGSVLKRIAFEQLFAYRTRYQKMPGSILTTDESTYGFLTQVQLNRFLNTLMQSCDVQVLYSASLGAVALGAM